MIQKAVFTGALHEDGLHVEVRLPFGVTRYALPTFAFPLIGVMSQMWLDTHGKKYWALVDYDQANMEKLILVGVVPMTGQNFPPEGLENKYYFYTSKFRIFVDDTTDNFAIERLDGSGTINLGSTHAAEFAVLGNTLVNMIGTFIDVLKSAKVLTALGPQPFMADTQVALQDIYDNLDAVLSQVNKLD